MKLIDSLKVKAKLLKSELTALYYAYRHPDTKLLPKMIILCALGYSLCPIDLIPDFIPVLGYLDDLLIVPLLITLSLKVIPKDIMSECRKRASEEPLLLRNNIVAAVIFVGIWITLFVFIAITAMKLIRS